MEVLKQLCNVVLVKRLLGFVPKHRLAAGWLESCSYFLGGGSDIASSFYPKTVTGYFGTMVSALIALIAFLEPPLKPYS